MSTFATLRSLHSLMGNALADIERVFSQHISPVSQHLGSSHSQSPSSSSASSHISQSAPSVPLDFPSLDSSYDSSSLAEALLSDPTVVQATKIIVASAGQITAMIQRPFLTICNASMAYHLPSCMRFLEASNIVEILRESGPEGLHVIEIAKSSGCDPSKLVHILRLLATHHIGREISLDVFVNNRLSSFIDSGKTVAELKEKPHEKYEGTNGIAAFVGLCTDEIFKSSAHLTEAFLLNSSSKYSSLPSASPFNLAFNTKQQFFAWLEHDENSTRLRRFGRAMMSTTGWEDAGSVSQIDAFPWSTLSTDSLIVDIGGGIGSTSMLLAKAFPHLRFCVQDRPKVVELGLSAWQDRCPELLESGRTIFQAHDFFAPQPIQNASVFLLRVITHDWPDSFAVRILLQLRHAATPTTKLILAGYILPLACEDVSSESGVTRTLAPPGSSLLANLGVGNANVYWLDMTMRVIFNSQERTLREISALTLTAGWQVVNVSQTSEGSLFGSIIAVPVSVPPSPDLVSPIIDREIHERCLSPALDTFYSGAELPVTPGRGGLPGSVSDSAVMWMKQKIRKTLSRTFRSGLGVAMEDPKERPLLPPFEFATSKNG